MNLLLWDPALPSGMHFNSGYSVAKPGSFCTHPRLWQKGTPAPPTSLGYLHAADPSLPPGLSCGVWVLAPSPTGPSRHMSWPGECSKVAGTLCAGFSLFCLLHSPLSLWSSLSVLADLSTGEGASQNQRTFPVSQLHPRATGPILIPFFFFQP